GCDDPPARNTLCRDPPPLRRFRARCAHRRGSGGSHRRLHAGALAGSRAPGTVAVVRQIRVGALLRSGSTLAAAIAVFAVVTLVPTQLHAQRTSGLAGGVRPELRVDVRWAGAPDGQAMLGGSVPL